MNTQRWITIGVVLVIIALFVAISVVREEPEAEAVMETPTMTPTPTPAVDATQTVLPTMTPLVFVGEGTPTPIGDEPYLLELARPFEGFRKRRVIFSPLVEGLHRYPNGCSELADERRVISHANYSLFSLYLAVGPATEELDDPFAELRLELRRPTDRPGSLGRLPL